MKFERKIYLLFIAFLTLASATASYGQQSVKTDAVRKKKPDYSFKSKMWFVELDGLAGASLPSMQGVDLTKGYNDVAFSKTGYFKVNNAASSGFDGQIGYFFGDERHFGIGTGIKLFYQHYDLRLSGFEMDYKSTDAFGNVFRQDLTSVGSISESIYETNINIPLAFKYKTVLKKRWGLTADVGVLFNILESGSYTTNAVFNYEAVYKFVDNEGNQVAVYDNSIPAGQNDILITRASTKGNAVNYFDSLRAHGYNVGLDVHPNSNTGTASLGQLSLGFFFQPALTYALDERTSINLGFHYVYQNMTQDVSNYRITDKVGDYTPLFKSAPVTVIQTYGLNLGVRYYFGKLRDRDRDGVPDKFDRCPLDSGVVKLKGCPDSDMDGIADVSDSCPKQFGLAKFNGCPDTDGDGIPDRSDSCPKQKGLIQFNGCPDTDGDGLPDNIDACPLLPGPADNHGCPLVAADSTLGKDGKGAGRGVARRGGKGGASAANKKVVYAKNVHFDFNQFKLNRSSFRYLDSIVNIMKTEPEAVLTIDGYSDAIGPTSANLRISRNRAMAVKRYMVKKGIDPAKLHAVGHGKSDPIASNRTRAGRAENRRALMMVKSNTANEDADSTMGDYASAISVTPNEEKGSFTILLKTNFEENAIVTILSPAGKMMKQFQIVANKPTQFTFDAPPGLYYFTAATASTKYEARIIISQ